MYSLLLFLHCIGAVMGLGAAFGFPLIAKSGTTTSKAKFALELINKLEILPKVGSIALLITGIIMGIISPDLFKTGWFILSIVIYLLVQIITIGLMPKQLKSQAQILQGHSAEELPQEYVILAKKSAKLDGITHLAAFVLILLMVFKPF